MRKILSVIAAGFLSLSSQAQHTQGIGIHFGGYDFYGPQTGDYFLTDQYSYKFNDGKGAYDTSIKSRLMWKPMVKVSYWWNINKMFDVNTSLSLANLEYPTSDDDTVYVIKYKYDIGGARNEQLLIEWDVRLNYNILPRDKWIASPYLFAGLNASYHDIFFGADIPLGLGVNINLTKKKDLSLNIESAYKVAVTDHDVNHLQHSIGVIYWFKPGYKVPKPEPAPAPIMDTDNDGIEDAEDQCPTIAGPAQFNGCPDSDNDGVSDKDDACPLVAGLAQFKGCPDSDGDGIPDNEDKCPYVAGTADRQGCPAPDRDKDGFTDDVDKCPDSYSLTNQGCPEISKSVVMQIDKAAKAIFFETGKATIKKNSYKSLDAVVEVLKSDPTLFADIEGHTDNVQAKSFTNQELSQRRAEAVRDYLVSKGINSDRLTATGFGETHPIADNNTAQGRAVNRRTVIKLRNYKE
jgi:outer membrane protein OmpA-like peptidoglycan-associated protein